MGRQGVGGCLICDLQPGTYTGQAPLLGPAQGADRDSGAAQRACAVSSKHDPAVLTPGPGWVPLGWVSAISSGEMGNPGDGRWGVIGGERTAVKTGTQRPFMMQTECEAVGKGRVIHHILLPPSP